MFCMGSSPSKYIHIFHRGGCTSALEDRFPVSRTKLVPPRRHFDHSFNRYSCMISLVRFTAGPVCTHSFSQRPLQRSYCLVVRCCVVAACLKKKINKSRIVITHQNGMRAEWQVRSVTYLKDNVVLKYFMVVQVFFFLLMRYVPSLLCSISNYN